MSTYDAEVVRETGRLLTRMTPEQLAHARLAAYLRRVPVTQHLRERIVSRIIGRAA